MRLCQLKIFRLFGLAILVGIIKNLDLFKRKISTPETYFIIINFQKVIVLVLVIVANLLVINLLNSTTVFSVALLPETLSD